MLRCFRQDRYKQCFGSIAGVLLIALGCASAGGAEATSTDPVEQLRLVLRENVDPATRPAALEKSVKALRTIGEMSRALALPDWREDPESPDLKIRAALAERLQANLQHALTGTNVSAAGRLAAIGLAGSLATGAQRGDPRREISANLGKDLEKIVRNHADQPRIRAAAALALAKSYAAPQPVAEALGSLLKSPDNLVLRRAGARGLVVLMEEAIQRSTGVASGGEIAPVATAVVNVAGPGLRDSDVLVRRLSMQAMRLATGEQTLRVTLPLQTSPEAAAPGAEAGRTVEPLARALANQSKTLAAALTDSDSSVRQMAAQVLDAMSLAWQQLPGKTTRSQPPQSAKDFLLEGLIRALHAIPSGLSDPQVRVRIATVEVLESLDLATVQATAPAVIPALVKTLYDPDRFVRWAASRTVGKMGFIPTALPGLIHVLEDPDPEVRMSAATALARYGPKAQDAVGALAATVERGDSTPRIAAINALIAIGKKQDPQVTQALLIGLKNEDARVRVAAATGLGVLASDTAPVVSALEKALNDTDADVQRAASEALLNLLPVSREL